VLITSKRYTGFTLAEVLITLSVIGVVAALTIPTVTKNVEKAQCRAAFKRNYAMLADAARRIMLDNGGTLAGAFENGGVGDSPLRDKFLEYIPAAKVCPEGEVGTCWHKDKVVRYLSPAKGYSYDRSVYANAILSSGALVSFMVNDPFCNDIDYGHPGETDPKFFNTCGTIWIDVNGFKGPNVIGKDVFTVKVRRNGIVPGGYGINPKSSNWQCKVTDTGEHCASAVLQNIDYY